MFAYIPGCISDFLKTFFIPPFSVFYFIILVHFFIIYPYRYLRLFKDAAHYSQEVDDYINPRDDYYEYMTQWLEMDSETYAELGVQEYYARIADWIEENGTESFTYK